MPPHLVDLPVASSDALERAADLISRAQRPLVMLGAAASRPRLGADLSEFLARTRIPYFSTQMGKGVVADGDGGEQVIDLWLGTAALSERDYVHEAIDAADVIIAIGHDTVEKPPFLMGPGGPTVIHISYTPANVEEVYFPHASVVGDVGPSLACSPTDSRAAAERLGVAAPAGQHPAPHHSRIRRRQIPAGAATHRGRCAQGHARQRHRRPGQRDVQDLVRPQLPLARVQHPAAGQRAGDHGRRSAVGDDGGLLYPHRRVLAVCGDGGFMMNSQELETAVRLGLNLVVLILQDDAYGMIRWKQAVDEFADFGLTFGNPDFVRYAEAYGARGTRIRATEELVPALHAAFDAGGVHLVTVPVDYSDNLRVLVDELRNRVPATAEVRREHHRRGAGSHGRGVRRTRSTKPLTIEKLLTRCTRARGGAGPHQSRRLVPLRPVGDQRQPAAADAHGPGPRGGRDRRGGRPRRGRAGGSDLDPVITSSSSSCPRAAIANRAPRDGRPCASRELRRTPPAHCCPAPTDCTAPTARPSTITSGCPPSPTTPMVSRRSLVKIDPELPFEEAALFGCAVLTGVGAVVNTARMPAGAAVAVVGLGGVGLSSLLGAVAAGARQVVAVDLSDEKLAFARELGATMTVNARDPDAADQIRAASRGGVEYAFELAGVPRGRSTWRSGSPAAAAPPSPPACPPHGDPPAAAR